MPDAREDVDVVDLALALGHMDTIHHMAALVGKDRIEGVEDPRRQVLGHHLATVSDPGQ